ncbi:MAG: hypothetical protein ABIR28_10540 [Vicinamibacteria bacterium]
MFRPFRFNLQQAARLKVAFAKGRIDLAADVGFAIVTHQLKRPGFDVQAKALRFGEEQVQFAKASQRLSRHRTRSTKTRRGFRAGHQCFREADRIAFP